MSDKDKATPIPIRHTTLRGIVDLDPIAAKIRIASESSAHGGMDPAAARGAVTGERADRLLAQAEGAAKVSKKVMGASTPKVSIPYSRGTLMKHKPTGKRVTIMASAGDKCEVIFNASGVKKKVLKTNLE
jgi:hypothetical protein